MASKVYPSPLSIIPSCPTRSVVSKKDIHHWHVASQFGSDISSHSLFNAYASKEVQEHLSTKCAFNALADRWGRDRKDEHGKELEGNSFAAQNRYALAVINDLIGKKGLIDANKLTSLQKHYQKSLSYLEKFDNIKTIDDLKEVILGIQEDLSALEIGKCLFIPLGWSGLSSHPLLEENQGHAEFCIIKKVGEDDFDFHFLDTSGFGIDKKKYSQFKTTIKSGGCNS